MLITFLPSSPTVEQAAANLICLQHTVIKKQQRRAPQSVMRVVVFGAKANEGGEVAVKMRKGTSRAGHCAKRQGLVFEQVGTQALGAFE
mgnify:FL=1